MNWIKEKLPTMIGVTIFIILCASAYYLCFYQNTNYFTQIDNTKVKKLSSSSIEYEYKLESYNENGKSKETSFKTTRELRESAYLKLEYNMIRGVIKWEEVQYDELPEKVQNKYTNEQ